MHLGHSQQMSAPCTSATRRQCHSHALWPILANATAMHHGHFQRMLQPCMMHLGHSWLMPGPCTMAIPSECHGHAPLPFLANATAMHLGHSQQMPAPCASANQCHDHTPWPFLGHACTLQLGHEGLDLGVLQAHQLLKFADLGLKDLRDRRRARAGLGESDGRLDRACWCTRP